MLAHSVFELWFEVLDIVENSKVAQSKVYQEGILGSTSIHKAQSHVGGSRRNYGSVMILGLAKNKSIEAQ